MPSKHLRRISGRFVVHHHDAFYFWRELVEKHRTKIDLIHVDAHADFGLGDSSWVNVVTHVLNLPVTERADPLQITLNAGNYIAYALGARWIASMVYVYHPHAGNDLPHIYFEDNDCSPPHRIQLKAYKADVTKAGDWPPPATEAVSFEPAVPFKKVPMTAFKTNKPLQYALLAQSPGFTPAASDALIPIFGEYIDFERAPETVIAKTKIVFP
jgi:hypothetical protein